MGYAILRRRWRLKRPMWALMVLELVGLVPLLVLFGIERPDLYRSQFWGIGFELKMNSNPNMILYAYANHRPLPTIPFVWSQMITDFNVAISIISLFTLLTKMITFIMKLWYPLISLLMSLAMTALYATSIYGQAGPDYADSRYPSWTPWYLRMSCDVAKPYGAASKCMMAKGTLAATVYMLAVYLGFLGLAIYSMLPNNQAEDNDDDEEEDGGRSAVASPATDKQWEMQPVTPGATPFTPRTQAFHTLERKLPLRYQ